MSARIRSKFGSRTSRRGFTLIELIAVVLVLGILAGAAIPMFLDQGRRAKVDAGRNARGTLATAVLNARMHDAMINGGLGAFPATLDNLLASHEGERMLNPFIGPTNQIYEVAASATGWHPADKLLGTGTTAAIWYNPNNGSVKFRVPRQTSASETIDLYNEVNDSVITSMSQETP